MTPWVRQVCSIISRQKVAAPFAAYGVTKCKDAFVWFRPYQRWIQPSKALHFRPETNFSDARNYFVAGFGSGVREFIEKMVPQDGVEPPTPAFSGLRSTT